MSYIHITHDIHCYIFIKNRAPHYKGHCLLSLIDRALYKLPVIRGTSLYRTATWSLKVTYGNECHKRTDKR